MRGAAASGAVKIKVGACDIEAMSPPMLPTARGGVIDPPLSVRSLTSPERRFDPLRIRYGAFREASVPFCEVTGRCHRAPAGHPFIHGSLSRCEKPPQQRGWTNVRDGLACCFVWRARDALGRWALSVFDAQSPTPAQVVSAESTPGRQRPPLSY
jgi:hypothetical protein